MSEELLSCAVFKGMFSDELAIKYPPRDRGQSHVSSFFVPRDQITTVSNDTGIGTLRVRVFRQGSTAWAVLPTENQAVIAVDDADLSNP